MRKGLTIIAILVTFVCTLGFALHSCGVFGETLVNRKVFENSYQRVSALKSRIAVDEATLASINVQLRSAELDPATRTNLEAQKAAILIRIRAAKGQLP